jgi:hypothetical protein
VEARRFSCRKRPAQGPLFVPFSLPSASRVLLILCLRRVQERGQKKRRGKEGESDKESALSVSLPIEQDKKVYNTVTALSFYFLLVLVGAGVPALPFFAFTAAERVERKSLPSAIAPAVSRRCSVRLEEYRERRRGTHASSVPTERLLHPKHFSEPVAMRP